MSLPPNFGVVGCGDELAAEIDDEFRHFFPTSSVKPNNSGKTECNPSVTGECRDDDVDTDCDIGSDVEDDELSGNEGLLRSPIIHSRVRVFMRDANCNGNTDDSDHDDDDGDDDDDYERTQILTAHKKCTKLCLAKFRDADVLENRLNVQEMDKDVKDMLIIGQLQACGTTNGADATLVKRHRYDYQFQNTSVCKSCFLYINNINGHYLKNVRAHFLKNGAVPRVHGNSGKKPKNAVRYEHVQQVIQFISRYADEVGLPQPAAPRGRDDFPPTYLPGCETYISVHQKYIQVCHETQSRCLSETTFRRIWHQCLPHIQFMTCRTDVCHKCEIFRNLIQKAVTEADKLQASTEYAEHISSAQEERNFYRERCRAAVTSLQGHPKSSVPVPHASVDLDDVHYTFDFAQSVLLPSHCRQEGALYFRSPYKANLFGVCNDGRTLQTNYLFGEDQSFDQDGIGSHSANAVVSMLHHFFQNHGEGEKTVFLNADNCGGQNKNQVVTSYLAWRVANGYHENIHLHFMKPYHARCLVDGMFGIARRKIRRSDVDSLPQLKTAVETSSTHNQADLYSELSANSWVWRDWKKFFKPIFRAVPGIGKCHHFHFAATNAGVVKVKTAVDGEETEVRLVKRGKNIPEGLPVRLEAKGLSPLRAWYLYKNIRPFVKDPCKDLLCPLPDVPEPPTGGSIQTEE